MLESDGRSPSEESYELNLSGLMSLAPHDLIAGEEEGGEEFREEGCRRQVWRGHREDPGSNGGAVLGGPRVLRGSLPAEPLHSGAWHHHPLDHGRLGSAQLDQSPAGPGPCQRHRRSLLRR